ncbi:hypothetical protein YC2023_013321 [Brassica napus]
MPESETESEKQILTIREFDQHSRRNFTNREAKAYTIQRFQADVPSACMSLLVGMQS